MALIIGAVVFFAGVLAGWLLKDILKKSYLESEHRAERGLLEQAKERNKTLEQDLQDLREKHLLAEKRLSGLAAEKEQQKPLREEFSAQFKNLSQTIVDQKALQFQQQAKKDLEGLLNPLKTDLQSFQKKVEETYSSEARERFSLVKEIKQLCETRGRLEDETRSLTQALKGDSRTQGQWGEMILETILQNSGLIEGEHYITQGKGLGLKDEEGRQQKPDVVLKLPDNKRLVIDAKVSLTHYERFHSSASKEERGGLLKNFLASLRSHVKQLSEKNYHHQINAPDFTFMFFPIEGALSLAFQNDRDLFRFSWKHHIAIVSPTSLSAALKVVESIWRREKENQNALKIAVAAGKLYDKFVLFDVDMQQVGSSLQKADQSYRNAMDKLYRGRGNMRDKLEHIKKLGARASKELPSQVPLVHD